MAGSGYSLVDQFCRAGELQLHFFRRCQREFRDDVLPTLAFVDAHGGVEGLQAVIAERDQLKKDLAAARRVSKIDAVGVSNVGPGVGKATVAR